MNCPNCKSKTKVDKTYSLMTQTYRIRKCINKKCLTLFTTIENRQNETTLIMNESNKPIKKYKIL